MKTYRLSWQGYHLDLGTRTAIMGVVNVTPDSFSDGGRFFAAADAIRQARSLVAAGADIIDIGGESTRPYADDVTAEEEIDRVVPVIEGLAGKINTPISIDTTKAVVAEAAIAAGASIINDVGALRLDPGLAKVAARHALPVILMHMQGLPRTMQLKPTYTDVVEDVKRFLGEAIQRAQAAGIERGKLIIDPGIGFGKTIAHNLSLLRGLAALAELNAPILVGPSRKTFIRKLLADPPAKELAADCPEVITGTQAAVAAAILNGAHIVRVHDVAATRSTVKIMDAIRNASA
jgi:dihydropteroate synthase